VTYELGENRYGKSRIRLVTVRRGPEQHHLRDMTVAVGLEGDFDAVHEDGDNANVIATDTMKNTVYAFARDRLTGSPEAFALELARHFAGYEVCRRATVDIVEHPWTRIPTPTGEAPDAFVRSGQHGRLASAAAERSGGVEVTAGIGAAWSPTVPWTTRRRGREPWRRSCTRWRTISAARCRSRSG
jgi:urate oxidase